ncbi:MAG: hypothetical protein WCT04_03275 [Planctomycetota bacterium]
MNFKAITLAVLITTSLLLAGETTTQGPDGIATWTPVASAAQLKGDFTASRWGMYDVEAQLDALGAAKFKGTLAGKELAGTSDGTAPAVKLGRLYIEKGGKLPLVLEATPSDAAKPATIKAIVLTPAPEGKPIVQADDLSITLHARDSIVHATTMRYEISPVKNTLGYWGNVKDWVSWDFELKKPGKFIVFVMHGSGGGSDVEITVGEQKLNWTTKNTGGYHTFTFLEVGTLTLDTPGPLSLTLKPTKKNGGAVMDMRQVILVPVLK